MPNTLGAQDNDSGTPAHGAAMQGHVGVLRCLHELVPTTLSARDNDGFIPAHFAAMQAT